MLLLQVRQGHLETLELLDLRDTPGSPVVKDALVAQGQPVHRDPLMSFVMDLKDLLVALERLAKPGLQVCIVFAAGLSLLP